MDQKNKIIDTDLPDPKPRVLTPGDFDQRRWRLLVTLVVFVTFYSLVHKLFLPAALKLTSLRASPYASIDPWFLLPVLLAVLAVRQGRQSKTLAFLAGLTVVYGIWEVFLVYEGRYTGWLAFSRLLSSVPLSILMVGFLSQRSFSAGTLPAWIGALVMFSIGAGEARDPDRLIVQKNTKASVPVVSATPVSSGETCGATTLGIGTSSLPKSKPLQILECGFSPSFIKVESAEIQMENTLNKALNVRALFFSNGKTHPGWNKWVPALSTVSLSIPSYASAEMTLLFSDNAPELGILALIPSENRHHWKLTRSPLQIEKLP